MACILDQLLARWLTTKSGQPARAHLCVAQTCSFKAERFAIVPARAGHAATRLVSIQAAAVDSPPAPQQSHPKIGFHGVHHIGILCQSLETSLYFYKDILGLDINPDRPHDKLPYDGAWLWIGPEMIHLMVLPNPDPLDGRPEHGGRDRHTCLGVASVQPIRDRLDAAGVPYTASKSGRAAIFFRDPDQNVLECVESQPWR